MEENSFLQLLTEAGGYWKYPGTGRFLARLVSGKVSDVYANSTPLLHKPAILKRVASLMVAKMGPINPEITKMVVGPAMGGITLSYEVASQLPLGQAGYTEPQYTVSEEAQQAIKEGQTKIWDALLEQNKEVTKAGAQTFDRIPIPSGRCQIIFVEDVVTTGESTRQMVEAVIRSYTKNRTTSNRPEDLVGGLELPSYIYCLIDRRADKAAPLHIANYSFTIISLAHIQARTWETLAEAQVACPSVQDAIKPKLNWKKLIEG